MRKFVALFLCFSMAFGQLLFAQNKTVSGKVLDDKGNPVTGASVLVKGSTIGTSTKPDGTFSFSVPSSSKELIISSLGFDKQEVKLSGNAIIVNLKTKNDNLDEVVVVAYGTAKKETLTGSVGKISAEDLKTRSISNVINSIEGAVPGVVLGSSNGQPGSSNAIRIRGFGSINATSEPLLVVDGVPYVGGTSNINPDDVESTTILKDASATALYGSRAANGVILITTKAGKKGRNNVSVRALQGFTSRGLPEYERLNAFQYYPIMWEVYRNSLVYPTSGTGISLDSANRVASGLTSRTSIHGLLAYNPFNVANNAIVGTNGQINPNAQLIYGDDLDWTNELLRTGNRQDYSVNFSGGADKSDYFVSVGYLNDKGFTIRSDLQRINARVNVNVQPKSWIKTGLNISGNYSVSNTASDDGSTSFVNPFFFARNIGPIYPVYAHNMTTGAYLLDANGQRFWDLGNMAAQGLGLPNRPSGGFGGRHSLAETRLNEAFFNRTVVSARQYTDLIFSKNFKFTNNISVDFQNQYNGTYENTLVGDGAPAGRADREFGGTTGFTLSQLFSYNQKFSDHNIDVLAGHETFNQFSQGQRGFRQGQSLSGNTELNNFTTINAATSYTDRYRIESFFSRLSYDFQGKYFVSGSLRRDGNSRFGPNNRYGLFPSISTRWRVSGENFMKNVKFVSELSFRASYGQAGNAPRRDYSFYNQYSNFGWTYAGQAGTFPSSVELSSLKYEVVHGKNVGINLIMLKNRLNIDVEVYQNTTRDLIMEGLRIPTFNGYSSINTNAGVLDNQGWEVNIISTPFKNSKWTVNFNFNIAQNENVLREVSPFINRSSGDVTTNGSYLTLLQVNNPYGSIYGYRFKGVYSDLAATVATDGSGKPIVGPNGQNIYMRFNYPRTNYVFQPGDAKYEDINKDGNIDYRDVVYLGNSNPRFSGGFGPSITYKKSLTITAFFNYRTNFDVVNGTKITTTNMFGFNNQSTAVLRRWRNPGDVTDIPRALWATGFNWLGSDRYVEDASFLRFRSLTVRYNFSNAMLKKLKMKNLSTYLTAENIMTFTKYTGQDPEVAPRGIGGPFTVVTDNSTTPPVFSLTFGVVASF